MRRRCEPLTTSRIAVNPTHECRSPRNHRELYPWACVSRLALSGVQPRSNLHPTKSACRLASPAATADRLRSPPACGMIPNVFDGARSAWRKTTTRAEARRRSRRPPHDCQGRLFAVAHGAICGSQRGAHANPAIAVTKRVGRSRTEPIDICSASPP